MRLTDGWKSVTRYWHAKSNRTGPHRLVMRKQNTADCRDHRGRGDSHLWTGKQLRNNCRGKIQLLFYSELIEWTRCYDFNNNQSYYICSPSHFRHWIQHCGTKVISPSAQCPSALFFLKQNMKEDLQRPRREAFCNWWHQPPPPLQ